MPKYKVYLGSLVTKLMKRTFIVSAPDKETAIERAKDRFVKACQRNKTYTDCGDTIMVDGISQESD